VGSRGGAELWAWAAFLALVRGMRGPTTVAGGAAVPAVPGVPGVYVERKDRTRGGRTPPKKPPRVRGGRRGFRFNAPGSLTKVYAVASGKGGGGKPPQYQLGGIDGLAKELADVQTTFKSLATKDARALDEALKQKKLEPLPAISELGAASSLDRYTLRCVNSRGGHCTRPTTRAAAKRD